jgi:uncharacterized protein
MVRSAFAAFVVAAFVWTDPSLAQLSAITDDDLYKAETIVTGQGEAERLRGFRIGAEDAVVKLTGNLKLATAARLKPILDEAAALVADFTYEEQTSATPAQGGQGTGEPPQSLRIRFDKGRMDAALAKARLKKWPAPRPLIVVWLGIREAKGKPYLLAAEGPQGHGQREVLKDASAKRGVPMVLPPAGSQAVTYEIIDKSQWGVLHQESDRLGAPAVLYGTLNFDGNTGWDTRWTLAGPGAYAKWSMKGVTFDVALKGAIDQAATAFAEKVK